jgi:D-arabinose 1-dehydrogenase-like Zn-dependent alcohol dehydrogenase
VTKYKIGDKVGVGCFVDSCRTCECCKKGLEQFCSNGASFTYNSFEQDKKTPTMGANNGRLFERADRQRRLCPAHPG